MLELKPKRHRHWGILAGLAIIVLLGGLGAALWLNQQKHQSNTPPVTSKTPIKRQPTATALSSRMLFAGTTFWGRSTEEWAMASPQKYAFPFARLNELKRSSYDAWIAGLECPMKASVHMTAAEQEENLQFNCSPKFLPEAKKYFTAFTLANNHVDNQGADGFSETQRHLDESGIQYFGHYDLNNTEDVCEVISLPVQVEYDTGKTVQEKLPVAMCGFHGVFGIPPQAQIDQIKQYAATMPVFALPHMGAEYTAAPDEIKSDVYRRMIDAGADVVIGDHPHWIQSTESYKGRLIVYSMGNFMFDQQQGLEVTRSAAIRVRLSVAAKNTHLDDWLAVGADCVEYDDECLEKIAFKKLKKLPFAYEFGVVGTRDDQRQTHLATPAEQQAILQRLNWQATMTKLQPPYRGEK